MDYKVISSSEAAKLICMPYSEELSLQVLCANPSNAIYVGQTKNYSANFFLDLGQSMNPHIFVFGMSGSGKSYLLKSMMARYLAFSDQSLLIIDFTGEYRDFADLLFSAAPKYEEVLSPFEKKLTYIDLSKRSEGEKVDTSLNYLNLLLEEMRIRGPSKDARLLVLLDEAWKLLLGSEMLDVLIREGRKYGVGMVMASQLLGDIKDAFLSNVATIFAFRMQDAQSLEKLQRCYSLEPQLALKIQNLERGSCIAIRLYKGEKRDAFQIREVSGVELSRPLTLIMRDEMRFEVDEKRFTEFLHSVGLPPQEIPKLRQLFEGNYSVELPSLLSRLLELGAERRALLSQLRLLGIDDASIADGFSRAITDSVVR
ncbi:MAG: ATP-binding protein [Candidatus Micrarchaeota archaeon]|nr:ATP-binding protein [Candidatus Micrarchaeota archaeon]